MARDTSPQCKQCRREGTKLFLKGERCLTDKCGIERRNYTPGDHGRGRPRQSEYLLRILESRLDNVLVRLGFAASRRQARQMVRHGHWMVNGRRLDIPSYQVRPDDVITLAPGFAADQMIRDATELVSVVPAWLQADHDGLTAKVLRRPERDEIAVPVQEQLIVELYSK